MRLYQEGQLGSDLPKQVLRKRSSITPNLECKFVHKKFRLNDRFQVVMHGREEVKRLLLRKRLLSMACSCHTG
ncbi:hypothetical protein EUGRSUZ_L02551 [Eucalyptus grandis]|uniref:Uncharacterized protein n=1 Tax=Eucalyptus grandis TaxID=71139 RepID=A0AAD9T9A2_EUCGR|nr:hypothetical protein EUGRSUZ_L02551 [Eucalyptus grandis]